MPYYELPTLLLKYMHNYTHVYYYIAVLVITTVLGNQVSITAEVGNFLVQWSCYSTFSDFKLHV